MKEKKVLFRKVADSKKFLSQENQTSPKQMAER